MDEINFYLKDERFGYMSNFWPLRDPIKDEYGIEYWTTEAYYQAQKTSDGVIRKWISIASKPYLAMIIGRALREKDGLYPDWNDRKVNVMLEALRMKFKDNQLSIQLLSTGYRVIHEDSQTDMFWGKKGQDMLGKLLMKVREEIRDKKINERLHASLDEQCQTTACKEEHH